MSILVNLIYISKSWEEVRLESFIKSGDYIIFDELTFDDFAGRQGGIELISNNYCMFFRQITFYDLQDCVLFFIKTLLLTGRLKNELFSFIDFSDEKIAVICDELGNSLKVKKCSVDNMVSISFLKGEEDYSWSRNNPFFENVKFDVKQWDEAVITALNEFFTILKMFKEFNSKRFIYEVLQNWEISFL